MNIAYYMDVHVRSAVTRGLRLAGVDVLTAQEDGAAELDDAELLDRATQLNRVLFSQDVDLLVIANDRQSQQREFAGVIYAHQREITIGQAVQDLTFITELAEAEELRNRVLHLPL